MFIVIVSDYIQDKTWPLVENGCVCIFSTVQSAHEYMRNELGGVEVPNKKSYLSGCGKYNHNDKCRSGKYEIQKVKTINAARQEPEPELEPDPYDGLSPADFYGECR